MSLHLDDLINIDFIDRQYIHTKDNEIKILCEIIFLPQNDRDVLFDDFLKDLDKPIQFVFMKQPLKKDILHLYLENMINENVHSRYTRNMLIYVEHLKKIIPSFNQFSLFTIITIQNKVSDYEHILSVFKMLHISYRVLQESDMKAYLYSICI